MFVGHFGVGFGAKAAAPRASLGTLFLASQLVDLLWATFLLLGLESVRIRPGITRVTPLDFESYPLSHSLLLVAGWAVLFGLVYGLFRRYPAGAFVTAGCVVSHWLLDLVVHRPDLPLTPAGTVKVGLGLWSSLPGTLAVEFLLLAGGAALYARSTRATDRFGRYGFWGLVGFLAAAYASNLMSPAPPSVAAIAWAGQAQWLIVLFAYALDRHRHVARTATREDAAPANRRERPVATRGGTPVEA